MPPTPTRLFSLDRVPSQSVRCSSSRTARTAFVRWIGPTTSAVVAATAAPVWLRRLHDRGGPCAICRPPLARGVLRRRFHLSRQVPVETGGTLFQREVCQNSAGFRRRTLTYGALAARIGRPAPCAPLASQTPRIHRIVVPCHRVIGADGSLTGTAAASNASGGCSRTKECCWHVRNAGADRRFVAYDV